jgi:predicted  nucleic acid-binding Zn-ribbon protein
MGPVLNGLLKLQSVENRLRAAKTKLTRCRRNVIIQENQIRTLQNALEAKQEEIQLTKMQSDRLEYAMLLTQLNTTKADNSKIETQVLDLMKDVEVDEAQYKETEKQIEQEKEKLGEIRKDSEVQAQKYEKDITAIQVEWDEASKEIPPDVLEVFKRVAETYDGEAIATIDQQDSKSAAYNCGGCFMGITAESVNQLMTRDEIIRCPNCTRILVLGNTDE